MIAGPPRVRRGRRVRFLGFFVVAVVIWMLAGKIARRIARPLSELVYVAAGDWRRAAARARDGDALERRDRRAVARDQRHGGAHREADHRPARAAGRRVARDPHAAGAHPRAAGDRPAERGQAGDARRARARGDRDRHAGRRAAGQRAPRLRGAVAAAARRGGGGAPGARARGAARGLLAVAPESEGALGFEADATLVARALANLLDNARRHAGGATALRVGARGGFVVFDVEDGGPGFPADDKTAPRAEGSLGLGLVLVRRIADAHHGMLTLVNRAEGGARASIAFPVPVARERLSWSPRKNRRGAGTPRARFEEAPRRPWRLGGLSRSSEFFEGSERDDILGRMKNGLRPLVVVGQHRVISPLARIQLRAGCA